MSQPELPSPDTVVKNKPALKTQTPRTKSSYKPPASSLQSLSKSLAFAASTAISLVAAGFCLGILTLGKLPELSLLESGFLLLITAIVGCTVKSRKSLIAVLLFAGFLIGAHQIERSIDNNLSSRLWLPQKADVIAISTGLPAQTPSGYRQEFTLMGYDPGSARIQSQSAQPKVLVYLSNSSETLAHEPLGQWYRLQLKLNPIRSSASPAFSQEKWLLPQEVVATGYLYEAKQIAAAGAQIERAEVTESLLALSAGPTDTELGTYRAGNQVFLSASDPTLSWFESMNLKVNQHRMNLRELMLGVQTTKPEASGLSLSLLTGDRGVLNPKITELYQHFGISHLLAISGPHVLFAALVFSVLLRLLLNLMPISYRLIDRGSWVAPGAILAAGAYAWLSGLDVPALRTLIMFALAGAGLRVGSLSISQILVLCAAIILVLRPLSIFEVGFWLSLAGVSALIMISRMLSGHAGVADRQMPVLAKLRSLLARAVIVQAMIFALLLPITLGFFGEFSALAIPANLIAVGVIGLVVVPLNLLGYLVLGLSPNVANLIFSANIWLIDQFNQLLFWIQRLTPSAMIQSNWSTIELLIVLLALMILLVFTGRAKLMGVLLILLVWVPKKAEPDQLIVFDGLSFTATALISANESPWLVISDLPKLSARSDKSLVYEISALSEQLLHRSERWRLTMSEGEQTASWQQLIALMPELQIERVISNRSSDTLVDGVLSSVCEAGDRLSFGAGELEFLAPWGDLDTGDGAGCVVGWRKDDQELALILPDKAITSVQVLKQMCLLPDAKVTVLPASTSKTVLDELSGVSAKKNWLVHALSFTGRAPDWSWRSTQLADLSGHSDQMANQNPSQIRQSGHLAQTASNAHLINLRETGQITAVFEGDRTKLLTYRAGKPWLSVTQLPSKTPQTVKD